MSDQPPRAEDREDTTTRGQPAARAGRRLRSRPRDHRAAVRIEAAGTARPTPIDVNHDACILCDRCVRACDDIQGNDVIGRSGKGYCTRSRSTSTTRWAPALRHARRMRAGLPDRRATNKAIRGMAIRPRESSTQWQPVPILRLGLRPDLLRRPRGRGDLLRRGPRPARVAEQAVREGPLRLGLPQHPPRTTACP